jgi:hypothetical protein
MRSDSIWLDNSPVRSTLLPNPQNDSGVYPTYFFRLIINIRCIIIIIASIRMEVQDKIDEPTAPDVLPSPEPAAETLLEPQPITPQQMEVHHHPNVEKKTFKDYLLEGLMIFIAVMLGFFAENAREHFGDQSKEREYVVSIRHDMQADINSLDVWIPGLFERIHQFDTLISLLESSDIGSHGNELYLYARLSTRTRVFEANDNTLLELKNSGNFRLIADRKVIGAITDFQKDMQNYLTLNSVDTKEAEMLYPVIGNLFDASVFNKMITADTSGLNAFQINSSTNLSFNNPALRKLDKDALNLLIYYLHQRKATFIGEMRLLRIQKREAEELIQLINSEYHLNAEP